MLDTFMPQVVKYRPMDGHFFSHDTPTVRIVTVLITPIGEALNINLVQTSRPSYICNMQIACCMLQHSIASVSPG